MGAEEQKSVEICVENQKEENQKEENQKEKNQEEDTAELKNKNYF